MSSQQIGSIPSIQQKTQLKINSNTPSMQGQGVEEVIQNSANNNYIANRMRASEDSNSAATLPLAVGSWYLIAQGMEKVNKKYRGTYEQSLSGKVGGWADRFCQNTWLGRKIEGGLNWIDNKFLNISKKNKIIYSLRNHSTQPEWKLAKVPGSGLTGFFTADAENVVEQFLKPIAGRKSSLLGGLIPMGTTNDFQKLEQYGKSQEYINNLVSSLKGKTKLEKTLALQTEELLCLGADQKVIDSVARSSGLEGLQKFAQNLKAKKLGFKSYRHYKMFEGKFLENATQVRNILRQGDQNLVFSIGRNNTNLWGKIKSHLFGRQVGLSEEVNKFTTVLGKGNKTKLGRALPKALGWIFEGGTNRFGGGKLAVFLQAFIFADILYHTIKSPWKEKGKVFAERCLNDFGYFVGLTLGILGMHKIGGFKYAGLTKRGRVLYRQKLREFNAKVDAGQLNTKAKYKLAEQHLDHYLGAQNIKNPITKFLHKLGKFINMGNESKHAYRSTNKLNMNFARKLFGKNLVGVPLRILIPMAIVVPLVAKYGAKLSHAIFGKPEKSVLDEDKEAEEQQEIDPTQLSQEQQDYFQKLMEQQNRKPRDPNSYTSDTNLIKMTSNGQKPVRYQSPAQANDEPAEDAPIDGITKNTPNRYIPSSDGVVEEQKSDAEFNKTMARLDMAEKSIEQTLAMRLR